MIFSALLLSVMAVTNDSCKAVGIQIDSIRFAGLYGDTLAVHKMDCLAASGHLDQSEVLFWRYRYLQLYPCEIVYYEHGIKPWRVAAQFLSIGLRNHRVVPCREKIERAIVRVCRNDSSRTYMPCNPYRNEKPRPQLLARPPQPDNKGVKK